VDRKVRRGRARAYMRARLVAWERLPHILRLRVSHPEPARRLPQHLAQVEQAALRDE